MKKYKYIRVMNIENYDGWEIIKIIPKVENNADYCMAVIMYEDKPMQKDVYLTETTDEQLIEELHKRLIHNN